MQHPKLLGPDPGVEDTMLKLFTREPQGPSRQATQTGDDALIQSENAESFLATARSIVGSRHVLTRPGQTRRFRTGYRFGAGKVLAVVRPGTSG